MINNKMLGKVIKEIRKNQGFKTYQLARIVDKSPESIKKYENGYTTIPINILQDICKALGYNLELSIVSDTKRYEIK